METAIAVPNETQLAAKENDYLSLAQALVIDSDAKLKEADRLSMGLLALEKEIKADFRSSKDAAHAAHKEIVAQESAHLDKVQAPRAILRTKIAAYQQKQEAARIAEERRLQAIADKRAEDEAIAAAAAAEKSGDMAQAEAIISAPVQAPAVILARTTPKVQTRLAQPWTFTAISLDRMTNQQLLDARAYLSWDTVKLGQQARSTHDSIKVPGVTFHLKPL